MNTRPDGRLQQDTAAWNGDGTPLTVGLSIVGNLTASQTDLDRWVPADAFLAERHNNAAVLCDIQIHCQTGGAGGTGSDIYILKSIDGSGNVLGTLATITVPANTKSYRRDLRTLNVGIPLPAGTGIRLDTGTIGAGYSTTPASVKIKLGLEAFAVKA